ncbi:MAG: TIR domain-containing protein [Lachnospiraceae bacterium]|jgi:WD40 repeat protein|nr:TIR domain-containing protein [Lachnospiraceae bacterium]
MNGQEHQYEQGNPEVAGLRPVTGAPIDGEYRTSQSHHGAGLPLVTGDPIPAGGETYRYEAFISYCHNMRDSPIAETLLKDLEKFTIPSGKLRRQAGKRKLGRMFRDAEELPLAGDLDEAIKSALNASKWLIILCCPQFGQSAWCMRELHCFLETHDRRRVLPLVTEGVPRDVFPDDIMEVGPDGVVREPLAMVVADTTARGRIRRLRREELRLIAAMLGTDYDDLNQRFERRKRHVTALVAGGVAAAALFVAGMAVFSARAIDAQRVVAATNEMYLLAQQAITAVDDGDRLKGMEYAVAAYDAYRALYVQPDQPAAKDGEDAALLAAFPKQGDGALVAGQAYGASGLAAGSLGRLGAWAASSGWSLPSFLRTVPDGPQEALSGIREALEYASYTQSFQLLASSDNQYRNIYGLAYSPDDEYLLGIISGNSVCLLRGSDGKFLYSVREDTGQIDFAQFSPGGGYFLALSVVDGAVGVWETGDSPRRTAGLRLESGYDYGLAGAAFLSERALILTVSYPGKATGDEPGTSGAGANDAGAASHTWEKDIEPGIYKWDFEDNELDLLATPGAGVASRFVYGVTLSPDKNMAVHEVYEQPEVEVILPKTGGRILLPAGIGGQNLQGGQNRASADESMTQDATDGSAGSAPGAGIGAESPSAAPVDSSGGFGKTFMRFAFSPDSRLLAGASYGGVTVWDIESRRILWEYEGTCDGTPVFSPDQTMLAVPHAQSVTVVDALTGETLYTVEDDIDSIIVMETAFSPDSGLLCLYHGGMLICDARTGKPMSNLEGRSVVSVAFSGDGKRLAASDVDGRCGLYATPLSASAVVMEADAWSEKLYHAPEWYDTAAGYPDKASDPLGGSGSDLGAAEGGGTDGGAPHAALAYSFMTRHVADPGAPPFAPYMRNEPTGRFYAMAYPDGIIEVWDVGGGGGEDGLYPAYSLREHYGMVSSMLMTRDVLVSSGYDGRLMVFDLLKGEVRFMIPVGERVPGIDIDPEGRLVMAMTESGSYADVYDLATGHRLYRLRAEPGDRIVDMGFLTDGDGVAGNTDGAGGIDPADRADGTGVIGPTDRAGGTGGTGRTDIDGGVDGGDQTGGVGVAGNNAGRTRQVVAVMESGRAIVGDIYEETGELVALAKETLGFHENHQN